ncbi:MAG: hypothetical protein ACFFBR_09835 [Promethearchaeota archaeon]
MTESETPKKLVRIGGWLQIPFSLLIVLISIWMFWLMWPVLIDPVFWGLFGWWTAVLLGFLIACGIIGFILAYLWIKWQHNISEKKNRLITTGIIGIIFTGTVPGMLVILGAAIYPED